MKTEEDEVEGGEKGGDGTKERSYTREEEDEEEEAGAGHNKSCCWVDVCFIERCSSLSPVKACKARPRAGNVCVNLACRAC